MQTQKRQHGHDDDYRTDEPNEVIHCGSPFVEVTGETEVTTDSSLESAILGFVCIVGVAGTLIHTSNDQFSWLAST